MGSLSAFNVSSSSGPLGSFLSQSSSSGLLGALGGNSAATATQTALRSGGMTNAQHNAITAIAVGGTQGEEIDWNANGTEPTTLQNLRTYGWAKLTKKNISGGKVTGGVYTLTQVGKAIYARTGGGKVGTTGTDSDGISDDTKKAITAAVASIQGLLGSSDSSSTSSGISTGTTASTVNILT